jgi:hypothetical protein
MLLLECLNFIFGSLSFLDDVLVFLVGMALTIFLLQMFDLFSGGGCSINCVNNGFVEDLPFLDIVCNVFAPAIDLCLSSDCSMLLLSGFTLSVFIPASLPVQSFPEYPSSKLLFPLS